MTYFVTWIGKDSITLFSPQREIAIQVDKNGISEHIQVDEKMVCPKHETWNMFDEKERKYYCPHCQ